MVLAVCRRILCDANDAEDAFQATFLVLARNAGRIVLGEGLAGWLYRVACRAALRIRASMTRRRSREETGIEQLCAADIDPGWRELKRVLDEEIARLPARHRAVFILCCLEGKTGPEAGRLLGCPAGTVSSRLTRARERLRDRLIRRGFAPAAAVAALSTLTREAVAVVPSELIETTLRAVPTFLMGYPGGNPTAVAKGVIRNMTIAKSKLVAVFIVAGLLAMGGVFASVDPATDSPQTTPFRAKAPAQAKPNNPPLVQVVKPHPGGLDRVAAYPGTAEAYEQVELVAGATGYIKLMSVDIGDRVRAGQVLAEIDAPDLPLNLTQAEIVVKQAKSQVAEFKAKVFAAQAEIDAAQGAVKQAASQLSVVKANLKYRQKMFDREKDLFDKNAVDRRALDAAEEQFRTAEAQVESAEAAVETSRIDVKVKEAKLAQAKTAVDTASLNVEAANLGLERAKLAQARTRITAPFDGVIVRRNTLAGDFVRSGDAAVRRPLLTVMRIDKIRVIIAVNERDIAATQPGTPVEVTFDGMPGMKVEGKVARVGFALDPTNRTMRAEIDVPNPEGKLRPGMYGTTTLKLGKGPPEALRIPAASLVQVGGTKPGATIYAVYVYRNGKARRMLVTVSYQSEKEVEISAGIHAEDLVVTNPRDLTPKTEVPVEIEKPDQKK